MKLDLCARDSKLMTYFRLYILCTDFPSLVVIIGI